MEARTFVSDASDLDFQEKVLLRSQEVPILLDCWAAWCEPCKTIGPILEKLAREYEGRFELVKVDVDACQQIATGLRIQSVPTLYLFKDGQPVDGAQGAQSEAAIRALLDRHVAPPAFDPLVAARTAVTAGDTDTAAQLYRGLLEEDAEHGDALLGMARLALSQTDASAAQGWLDKITTENEAFDSAQKLRGVVGFSNDAGDLIDLQSAVDADPSNVEAFYGLGATLALANRFDEAFEAFLKVVMIDREYREDAGRKALLSIFEVVGMDDPLVVATRRRLAALLF
jgi:putative thioredoxin